MSTSKRKSRGVAWKVIGGTLLITGALAGPASAVVLPAPALEHGNAGAHVPVEKTPVLALGHDWT